MVGGQAFMSKFNLSRYTKSIIAVLTNAETVMSVYPHVHWIQAVSGIVGTILVYLVPNAPKEPANPEV